MMLVTNDGQNGDLVDHLELGGSFFFAQWRLGISLRIFTAFTNADYLPFELSTYVRVGLAPLIMVDYILG